MPMKIHSYLLNFYGDQKFVIRNKMKMTNLRNFLCASFFFYVPRPFIIWAIMSLHNFLSLGGFSPFAKVPAIHSTSSSDAIRYLLLSLLPSISHVRVKFPKTSYLIIICSKNISCLFLVLNISVL